MTRETPLERTETLPTPRAAMELIDTLPTARSTVDLVETLPMSRMPRGAPGRLELGGPSTSQPIRRVFLSRMLAMVARWTSGRAALVQRVFTYLCVGGMAAVVNLACFYVLYYRVQLVSGSSTLSQTFRYLVAFAISMEISIIVNFLANDRITFHALPGHARSWPARCARFHVTCIFGTVVTLVLSYVLHLFMAALLAQAISLVVVTAINFVNHHLFTYRHPVAHR